MKEERMSIVWIGWEGYKEGKDEYIMNTGWERYEEGNYESIVWIGWVRY